MQKPKIIGVVRMPILGCMINNDEFVIEQRRNHFVILKNGEPMIYSLDYKILARMIALLS